MKNQVLFLASAFLFLTSCVGNPEGKKAETTDSVEIEEVNAAGVFLTIDTDQSKIVWKGSKVTGSHEGTIAIKEGAISVDNNTITGGSFVIDMNTITDTDMEGEYKEKLEEHLKSEDFFAVAEFPESTFTITSVTEGSEANQVVISGNLVIKGISKNITFDAQVEEISETALKATADFNIEREEWGVNYEGKKDDLISKEINFNISIVAKN